MKVALVIEYQGQAFSGWQIQAQGVRTVQGELEAALLTYLSSRGLNNPSQNLLDANQPNPRIVLSGSGRTDSGVHARGQVASFEWPDSVDFVPEELLRALNGITCRELAVRSLRQVDDEFDARFRPHRKRYSYRIEFGGPRSPLSIDRCWWLPQPLNILDMLAATRSFVGEHDFSAFRAIDCSSQTSVRTIVKSELELVSKGSLVFLIEGKGFLKNMVRIIVGTLVEIGQGKRGVDSIEQLLESGLREEAGITAPAQGLCLESVDYFE
jgi:tRNA pseudouridine38-40 synthase